MIHRSIFALKSHSSIHSLKVIRNIELSKINVYVYLDKITDKVGGGTNGKEEFSIGSTAVGRPPTIEMVQGDSDVPHWQHVFLGSLLLHLACVLVKVRKKHRQE